VSPAKPEPITTTFIINILQFFYSSKKFKEIKIFLIWMKKI